MAHEVGHKVYYPVPLHLQNDLPGFPLAAPNAARFMFPRNWHEVLSLPVYSPDAHDAERWC